MPEVPREMFTIDRMERVSTQQSDRMERVSTQRSDRMDRE